MKLIINGEEKPVENVSSLSSLLQHLGLKADRVAIELNREIVARKVWDSTLLKDGDRLEIVQFVGGGCCAVRDAIAEVDLGLKTCSVQFAKFQTGIQSCYAAPGLIPCYLVLA
jgi:sulfur carrier protein